MKKVSIEITLNYFYFTINACQFIQQYFNCISKTIEVIMKFNVIKCQKTVHLVHTKLY